jgi:hypothetical protein
VSEGIRLIARTTASTVPMPCALCGELFELLHDAVMLSVDGTPRGYVCPDCLSEGPFRVARKIRRRAQELRDLARNLLAAFPGSAWTELIRAAHDRAGYWDELAERVEKLTDWALEQS